MKSKESRSRGIDFDLITEERFLLLYIISNGIMECRLNGILGMKKG
jgi:hypothetical protein